MLNILTHIAEVNPESAFQLVDDLQHRLSGVLSLFPEAGAADGGSRRFLTIRRHSAVYRFDAAQDEVIVLDVFGPGMDWR